MIVHYGFKKSSLSEFFDVRTGKFLDLPAWLQPATVLSASSSISMGAACCGCFGDSWMSLAGGNKIKEEK